MFGFYVYVYICYHLELKINNLNRTFLYKETRITVMVMYFVVFF